MTIYGLDRVVIAVFFLKRMCAIMHGQAFASSTTKIFSAADVWRMLAQASNSDADVLVASTLMSSTIEVRFAVQIVAILMHTQNFLIV